MSKRSGDIQNTDGLKTKGGTVARVYNIRECASINLDSLATVSPVEVVTMSA